MNKKQITNRIAKSVVAMYRENHPEIPEPVRVSGLRCSPNKNYFHIYSNDTLREQNRLTEITQEAERMVTRLGLDSQWAFVIEEVDPVTYDIRPYLALLTGRRVLEIMDRAEDLSHTGSPGKNQRMPNLWCGVHAEDFEDSEWVIGSRPSHLLPRREEE